MKLVDSHCHLDNRKFAEDVDAVLARAREAGVERMLAIGTGDGPPDVDTGIRLAERYPFMLATVGVHPHDASKAHDETFEALRSRCTHPKVVAFGEIGLDYHYDFAPRDTQRAVFIRQLQIARDAGLPVVIHTREAWEDTMAILRDNPSGPGVFHCFTGGPAEADDAVALGFHVSFGGVLTFPKADALREAARQVPEDRILVETDAPYLAPASHRGKRNEPAFVVETVTCLAALREESPERMAAVTTANFDRLCLR